MSDTVTLWRPTGPEELALVELLSPLIGAGARPGQRVCQLPAFVRIGDSSRSNISEHVDDLLAGGIGE